jgi:CheY-like chemotaxis protein
MSRAKINLGGVTTLLVDGDTFMRGSIAQMLRRFGMNTPTICESGAATMAHLEHHYVELCMFEAILPDMGCAELIRWIRRQTKSPLRFVPIVVLTSYTLHRNLAIIRDAGANLIIKRPVSPQLLLDSITWLAKTSRSFIETAKYVGPDRRFRTLEPLDGKHKRETDVTKIGDTVSLDDRNEQTFSEPSLNRALAV